MDSNRAGSRSGTYWLLGAGGAAVALVAAGFWFSSSEMSRIAEERIEDVATSAAPAVVGTTALPEAPLQDAPDNAQSAAVEDTTTEEAIEPPAPAVAEDTARAPEVDEVRVDTNGTLVIAGRADPGARVEVLVDDEVVASADADAGGSFAALGTLSQSEDARTLTLQTRSAEGVVASNEEIILAPVVARLPVGKADANDNEGADPGPTIASTDDAPASEETSTDTPAVASVSDDPNLTDDRSDASTDTAALADEANTPAVAEATDAPAVAGVTDTPEGVTDTTDIAAAASAGASATNTAEGASATEADTTAAASAPEVEDSGTEIAVLRSDDAGVTLAAPGPPAQTVVLDTIGYNNEGEVQLAGRAEVGAVEIRAYLNNRAVAQLPVDDDGTWRGDVPSIDTGVYTLRVDSVDASGTVVSRIETPFKREEPAILAAATTTSAGPARAVTVQAGDTLWAIARDRYGEGLLYVQVFEANRSSIRDPDLIYPGQVFDLPAE